ncbi:hypothetical protein [Nereida ignava]|uniref:hypothetical protein n=1 Tax=Nereida ignava TaxID=282199 RepID=UPI0030FA1EAD
MALNFDAIALDANGVPSGGIPGNAAWTAMVADNALANSKNAKGVRFYGYNGVVRIVVKPLGADGGTSSVLGSNKLADLIVRARVVRTDAHEAYLLMEYVRPLLFGTVREASWDKLSSNLRSPICVMHSGVALTGSPWQHFAYDLVHRLHQQQLRCYDVRVGNTGVTPSQDKPSKKSLRLYDIDSIGSIASRRDLDMYYVSPSELYRSARGGLNLDLATDATVAAYNAARMYDRTAMACFAEECIPDKPGANNMAKALKFAVGTPQFARIAFTFVRDVKKNTAPENMSMRALCEQFVVTFVLPEYVRCRAVEVHEGETKEMFAVRMHERLSMSIGCQLLEDAAKQWDIIEGSRHRYNDHTTLET